MSNSITMRTLLMCICIGFFSVVSFSQPAIHIDEPLKVTEMVSIGKKITQTITLTNTGTEVLQMEVERTSCGCTSALLSSPSLKPKQMGTLIIEMQVSGWGIKTETVTLRTNDPTQPHPVVTIQVKMPVTVVPNPAQITMQAREGEATQRFMSLLLPNKATIVKISTQQNFVTANVVDSSPIEGGTLQRIEILLAASAPPGRLTDELTIKLRDAPISQIGVAVQGSVESDISVDPNPIFIGEVPQGGALRKTVVVQSHRGQAYSIKSIRNSNSRVIGQANSEIIAAAHAIEIDIKAEGDIGSFLREKVTINLSNGRSIEVPVVGMIVKAAAIGQGVTPTTALRVSAIAPDFTATDNNGNPWKLSDLRGGKNVLLTFFPKCFTGGCASHLTSLQTMLPMFDAVNTQILAVSVDPSEEQTAFAAKLGLQFPLLSDPQRQLSMLYGAARDKSDLAVRQSILIGKDGTIRFIDTGVNVQTHGADMLAKINELGLK